MTSLEHEAQRKTTMAHHPSCIYEQAWDVAPEHQPPCTCPAFWPHRVCVTCWQPPTRHKKDCPEAQRKAAA